MREGTSYEGYVQYADGSVICLQCHEGRHSECPDTDEGSGVLGDRGYNCECGPGDDAGGAAADARAVEAIAEMLRDPEWGVGMLEDIAELVRGTGRTVEDYPDGHATWERH